MGKIKCENCGRKIDSGFDYCPLCGCRVQHDNVAVKRGGRVGCVVSFFIMVIMCATAATVWLVMEHDREDELRLEAKHREDSIKAAEIARLRRMREVDDSLRLVADSVNMARQLESQFFTFADFVRVAPGGVCELCEPDEIVQRLRGRGYSTLSRSRADGRAVMGLNAEIRDGKIAGKTELFSAAGVWHGRVEVMFPSADYAERFVDEARHVGYKADGDGRWRRGEQSPVISRRSACVLELCETVRRTDDGD